MAKATSFVRDITVTLELTLEEALYVYGALNRTEPNPTTRFGEEYDDPVYTALGDALRDVGVDTRASLDYSGRQ